MSIPCLAQKSHLRLPFARSLTLAAIISFTLVSCSTPRKASNASGAAPQSESGSGADDPDLAELLNINALTSAAYARLSPGEESGAQRHAIRFEWMREMDAFLGR